MSEERRDAVRAAPGPAEPRRRRPRRWIRRVAIVVLAFMDLVVLAYVFRGPLLGRPLGRLVAKRISDALGIPVTLERVEGDYYTDLVLVGLKSGAGSEEPVRKLAWDRLRVTFHLYDVIRGLGLSAVRTVEAKGVVVDLDLETLAKAAAAGEPRPPRPPFFERIPKTLPRLDVEGRLGLLLPGGFAGADAVRVRTEGDAVRVRMSGIRFPPSLGTVPASDLDARLEHPGDRELVWTSDSAVGGVVVRRVRLLTDDAGQVGVDGALEVGGGSLAVALSGGSLRGTGRAIDLAAVPAWLMSLAGPPETLPHAGVVDFEATLASIRSPRSDVAGRVDAKNLRWADLSFDSVAGQGAWKTDRGRIDRLDLALADARVEVREAVLESGLPWLVRTAERIHVSVPRLDALAGPPPFDRLRKSLPAGLEGIEIDGEAVAPGRLRIDRFDLTGAGVRATGHGAVTAPADASAWRTSELDVDFEGALDDVAGFLPRDLLPETIEARAATFSGHAVGPIERPSGRLRLEAQGWRAWTEPVEALSLDADVAWPAADVHRLTVAGRDLAFEAEGRVDLVERTFAGARFTLDVRDLSALRALVPEAPALAGALRVSGTADKTSGSGVDGLVSRIALRGSDVEVGGRAVGRVEADIGTAGRAVSIATLHVEGPLARADVSGAVELKRAPSGNVSFDGVLYDLGVLSAIEPRFGSLSGSATIKGRVATTKGSGWDAATGDLDVVARNVHAAGRVADRLALKVSGDGRRVQVDLLEAAGPSWSLSARGSADPRVRSGAARVEALDVTVNGRQGALRSPLDVRWEAGEIALSHLDLAGLGGSVRGEIRYGATLGVDLAAAALDLGALRPDLLGHVDLKLTASGSRDEPKFTLSVEGADVEFRGHRGSLRLDTRQDETGLSVRSLDVEVQGLVSAHGSGRLPMSFGLGGVIARETEASTLHVDARVSDQAGWTALGLPAVADIPDLALAIDAEGRDLRARATFHDPTLRPPAAPVRFAGAGHADVRIRPDGSTVDLAMGSKPGAEVVAHLSSTRGFDWTKPGARTSLAALPIQGTVDATLADLSVLRQSVRGLERIAGRGRIHATVGGDTAGPVVEGEAAFDDVEIRFEGDAPGFESGVAHLKFSRDRTVDVERVEFRRGHAPFVLTGRMRFDERWRPDVERLDAKGQNVLIVEDRNIRLRADVDLGLVGPLDGLRASGRVNVTNGVWFEPIELFTTAGPTARPDVAPKTTNVSNEVMESLSIRTGPASTLALDVDVTADRSVMLRNNLLAGRLSTRLHVGGTGAAPELRGKVDLKNSLVKLPITRLKVDHGEVSFGPKDPFDPKLDVSAHSHVRGYDLDVHVSGRISNPEVTVSTAPALPRDEAMFLLATGATRAEVTGSGTTWGSLTRVGSLAGTGLASRLGSSDDPDEKTFVDRFTFETGRDPSRRGDDSIAVEYELNEHLYLRAERDRFDSYNTGVVWRLRFR